MNEEFRFGKAYYLIFIPGLFLFLFATACSVWFAVRDKEWIFFASTLISLFFLIITIWALRLMSHYVRINEQGISYYSKKNKVKTLAWDNIQRVEEKGGYSQCLVLYDQRDYKIMTILNHMEDFDCLRQLIIDYTPRLQRKLSQTKVFHRGLFQHTIFFVLIVFLLYAGSVQRSLSGGNLLAWGGLVLGCIWGFSREIYKVYISQENISLIYPFWRRTIGLSQIKIVKLHNVSNNRGGEFPHVLLELSTGKNVDLPLFKEGAIALSESIKRALRENTQ